MQEMIFILLGVFKFHGDNWHSSGEERRSSSSVVLPLAPCPICPLYFFRSLVYLQAGFTSDLPSVLQYKYCTDNFIHKQL